MQSTLRPNVCSAFDSCCLAMSFRSCLQATGCRVLATLCPRASLRAGSNRFTTSLSDPTGESLDVFKMVMGQQRRMQMNFIGFHSYPWAPANATASGRAVSQHHGH
jgi:hypothetical protein